MRWSRGIAIKTGGPERMLCLNSCKVQRYEFGLDSVPLPVETLRQYDCVLSAADQTVCAYDFVVKESSLIIDIRNAYSHVTHSREKTLCP